MPITLPKPGEVVASRRNEPKYGKAYFQREKLTIQVDTGSRRPYSIDLKTCTDSAELLDWILQIASKGWCTPKTLYDLVQCIEQACIDVHGKHAQGVFCPHGSSKEVQW